jgi:hypothetical protein
LSSIFGGNATGTGCSDGRDFQNVMLAGRGLDWFWAAYAKDLIDRKPGDLWN